MLAFNLTMILGRLGSVPKQYNRPDRKPFCTFQVAINERTEESDKAIWIDCEAWGNMATIIDRLHITTGQEVFLRGKLRNAQMPGSVKKTVVTVMDIKIFPLMPKTKESIDG